MEKKSTALDCHPLDDDACCYFYLVKIKEEGFEGCAEHVSFLGCCLVFLLGKNKRRRDTKLRIRVIIFSFVCSARDTRDTSCA